MTNATVERVLQLWVLFATCSVASAPISAQTLPPFQGFPADAPARLAQAVEGRVQRDAAAFGADDLALFASGQLDQRELVRTLWESIEGAMLQPASGESAATPLVDVLDGAIGAYMTELGHIAHEIDRQGGDTVATLAPLHPGEQGSGSIDIGTVGLFRQLQVSFRGEIVHPDGRTPAVVAVFYLLSSGGARPIPGRLLIPTAGAGPSFRAEIAGERGEREIRDYGWRPRLQHRTSILELMIEGRWTRVEDDVDVVPQRSSPADPRGFCDATCSDP